MDLRHILNPMPEPDDSPRNINNNSHSGETQATIVPPLSTLTTSSYLHSKFFLSPRRLDPETASQSTNSSTKRRRTNRGRSSPDRSKQLHSTAMGRSFSELEVPSDTSSNDDDHAVVKRGVAQLSLSGTSLLQAVLRIDEYASLQLGTRVEALKHGTQGTWYVARIVESASFPAHYIDGDEAQEVPSVWYPMVCVHYEGNFPRSIELTSRILTVTIGMDTSVLAAVDVRRRRYVPFRVDEL